MIRPVFREIELLYGCHESGFELPDDHRPVVILGPNGSGKTTLVEGMLRTLFGYDRRRGSDTARLESRRPWDREGMRGVLTLSRNGETYRIRREFDSDAVRVHSLEDGVEHFAGDGNPGARNQEARRYRQILTDLLGLADLDAYACTLFVRQGALTETRLGEHLLRVAAGGHSLVEAARREIAEAHRAVTRRPIHSGARAAVNPRELEKLTDEIAAIEARLGEARAAGERRGPLAVERERTAERLERLDEEVRLLEEAQFALSRGAALEMEGRHLREWARMLDRLEAEVRSDADAVREAEEAVERAAARGRLPSDFGERLARVDLRWRDLRSLDRARTRWPAALGILFLIGAAAALLAGQQFVAAVAAGSGLVALLGWLAFELDRRRRRRSIQREVRETLRDVPGADDLSPASRGDYLSRFEAQRRSERRLEEARVRLSDTLREARSALREAAAAGIAADGTGGERNGVGAAGRSAEERLAERLRTAAESARDRIARSRVELDRAGDASLRLPDGVPPTPAAVGDALRQRRQERARVHAQLQEIGQELLERGTPLDSAAALDATLAALLPRRDALLRKAEVLEAAHALIADAYDAFREKDQERLVRNVSNHALELSGGAVGPVVAPVVLEEARARAHDRDVPMDSPPLSFGEYHSLLLGIRLGAADFLAGVGILPPLIIDEPFAHLDLSHARAVWALLARVATQRQVVITTQDALLIEHLGIEPDLHLG